MRSILLLLIPALALAAPRKYRDEARDRTESAGTVLHLLSNGSGVSQIHTDLWNLFPSEFVGNWFGFDASTFAGPVSLTAVGAPSQQTDRVCPNGPNCESLASIRSDGVSAAYKTGTTANATPDWTACAFVNADTRVPNQYVLSRWGGSNGTNSWTILLSPNATTATAIVMNPSGTFTQINGGAIVAGQWAFVCASYDFVAEGTSVLTLYVDGAVAGSVNSATVAEAANTTPIVVGGAWGATVPTQGRFGAAFYTEKVLSASTIAAMASAVLPTVQGSRGETLTTTRSTVRSCCNASGTSCSIIPANRACEHDGAVDEQGAWTNLLQQYNALDQAIWAKSGTPTIVADAVIGPFGTKSADRLTVDGPANSTASVQQSVSGGSAGASYTPSFWFQRVSASGVISAANPGASANGQWDIDLSLLGSGWNWITAAHPAVSVVAPFTYTSGGVGGIVFRTKVSGALTVNIDAVQVENGTVAHPPCPTTTASAACNTDVTTVATPTGFNTSEGCAKLCLTPNWTGNPPANVFLLDGDPVGQQTRFFFLGTGGWINSQMSASSPTIAANHQAGVTRCYLADWSRSGNFIRTTNITDGVTGSGTYSVAAPTLDTAIGIGANRNGGLPLSWGRVSDIQFGLTPGACR